MARITHGTFPGPAGRLEYILNEEDQPAADAPRRAAVVCHPHPLYGGSMHTRIVFQTAQELARHRLPVLRFHFRGVGQSEGSHDQGRGEQQDIAAAIAFLRERYPWPVTLAGFSFGAATVVRLLASEPHLEVERVLLLGLPLGNHAGLPAAWAWRGPKWMISGEQDQFAGVEALEAWYAQLPQPKARTWIAGGDHFLTGRMEEYRQVLSRYLDSALAAG